MQFIITGYDGKDENALERRLAVREEHLKLAEQLLAEKKILFGGALLDENEAMIGSCVIVDFESREALDEYLKIEPYIIGNVWQKLEVKPYKVAPLFMQLFK